ncbi:hypothetical protein ACP70R_029080 [Stipagrostis hirtigluma subsp. patula]
MRKLGKPAVLTVALLAIAWQCSPRKMAAAQPWPPRPPQEQGDNDPRPPEELDPPEPLQLESPPPPGHGTPQPELPRQRLTPSSPRSELAPPQPPSSPPAPPTPGMTNYSSTGWTTMLVFGDSTVDPGNNNLLQTAAKANFLPYGVSFFGGKPTGRFTNGRLITDMLAERLGIARSIPGFLDPKLKPEQLRTGVSFASAGSGYDDATSGRSNVLSFSNQIEYLWRYKRNLKKLAGLKRAEQLVSKATFIVSAGTADLIFHYIASNQSAEDTQLQYENQLITHVANYTQVMRKLGGRRFVFVGVPPIGCLPIVRTLTGADNCHGKLNLLATSFNKKLAKMVHILKNEPDNRATFIDVYAIIAKATTDPNNFEADRDIKRLLWNRSN